MTTAHLGIREFLLAIADTSSDPRVPAQSRMSSGPLEFPWEPERASTPLIGARLRAEVERHQDAPARSEALRAVDGLHWCTACPDDTSSPCTALRLLALPFWTHPAYRVEWGLSSPPRLSVQRDPDNTAGTEYPSIATMPPPGMARRRIMRAAGINCGVADFSEQERVARGWFPRTKPPPN